MFQRFKIVKTVYNLKDSEAGLIKIMFIFPGKHSHVNKYQYLKEDETNHLNCCFSNKTLIVRTF